MFFTISYPKIIALKSIFDSTDDETKSDKGEHVLAIFKSNSCFVKTFSLHIFCSSSNHFLKKAKVEKMAPKKFQKAVLFKSQIVFS